MCGVVKKQLEVNKTNSLKSRYKLHNKKTTYIHVKFQLSKTWLEQQL